MVRISYTNKKSVFDYPGVARADAVEKAYEHCSIFRNDMVGDRLVPIPLETVVVEWVDRKTDTAERVPFPPQS